MGTILEFVDPDIAAACLNEYEELARSLLEHMGYAKTDSGVILGKRVKDGVTVSSARTEAWDVVKESPDATFYFSDPRSNCPRSGAPAAQCGALVSRWISDSLCVERDIPEAWWPDDDQGA